MKASIAGVVMVLLMFSVAETDLTAQISAEGTPLMNVKDFNPQEVMYVLSPLASIEARTVTSAPYHSAKKSLQYAVLRPVDLSPEFNGQWVERGEMRIWRAHIVSPGAYALSALFGEFSLREGVRLFMYNASGEVIRGAYTAANNKEYNRFFAGPVPGSELIIEMQVDKNVGSYGSLRIASVSHAVIPAEQSLRLDYPYLGSSQDCEIDINCIEGNQWQLAKRSIVHIITPTNLCTGVLVNNTAYNGKQYLVTAEHCINSDFYAQTSVFVFGYENSGCGVVDGTIEKSVSGSTLIATGDSLDFSLIEIDEKIPLEYNVYYSGWDLRPARFDSVVTLHHPNADALKISFDFDSVATPETVPGDLKDYIISSNYWVKQWNIGSTEGGSSGAPLFNKKKRLVGILSGGLASCGDSVGYDVLKDRTIFSLVDNEDDYFSKISYAWDYYMEHTKQLKAWLDPINSGSMTIGGLNPGTLGSMPAETVRKSFRIYPNPAADQLHISMESMHTGSCSVTLLDVMGRQVTRKEMTTPGNITLDVSPLLPGLYFIRIDTGTASETSRLIIE